MAGRDSSITIQSQPASPNFLRQNHDILRDLTQRVAEQSIQEARILELLGQPASRRPIGGDIEFKAKKHTIKMRDGRQPGESLVEFKPVSRAHSPIPMCSIRDLSDLKPRLRASKVHHRPTPKKQLKFKPVRS
ncbi:hypothetical protein PTSG_07030 [Salpingoeca rosetta]|uniref:Uncharacterized protein n=1 Tax=Salpingoeca rosetta (strain ATCC 50818 / BSB-021) TaxID=946362 RepID=F2UDU7_SALR5|nr:uncharacterized protein PTSG_07030 [Salpingoeca rosetta]EGD74797.1 hypothetical protein PTSG_07030 [Salpingoeca rosetta]|eukprot:XP_004992442.1 hypothetical protein PTSG_07030 [Salpingoeca rosetta]